MLLTLVLVAAAPVVGIVDTVGWTFMDNVAFPRHAVRTIERDPRYGTHIGWRLLDSNPNAVARAWYNFVNLSGQHDPHGVEMTPIAPYNRWLCGIGVLPSGCAVGTMACNYPTECLPLEATRDVAPGAGIFETASGPVGWWPVMAVTSNGWLHFAFWSYPPSDTMRYSRIEAWPVWANPVVIAPLTGQPLSPGLPLQNLVASGQTNRIALLWLVADTIALRVSTDAGSTWSPVSGLVAPAFTPGSETLAVFRGASGLFDQDDSLHVVATVVPYVRDTLRTRVAEVWHCSSGRWSRVRRAAPESLAAPLGQDEDILDRVSIGMHASSADTILVSVWQERTPTNPEPLTDCLRSSVWFSASSDMGRTWSESGPLTDTTSTVSNCLPYVAQTADDRVRVCYIADSIAGQGVGPMTWNPVIVHSVPVSQPGVEERDGAGTYRSTRQTVARGTLWLPQTPGIEPQASVLLDASGRVVMDLRPGANDVSRLAPGVYFVRSEPSAVSRHPAAVSKVVVTR